MITQDEIDKAACKYEDYIGDESDLDGAEKAGKYHGFKAGVEWALEQIEYKKELFAINEAVEGVNSWVRFNKRLEKVTRVEVIDWGNGTGRVYTNRNCKNVEVDIQDDGRTLKLFLK